MSPQKLVFTANSALYAAYLEYCLSKGRNPISCDHFIEDLSAKGFQAVHDKGDLWWYGIGLRPLSRDADRE